MPALILIDYNNLANAPAKLTDAFTAWLSNSPLAASAGAVVDISVRAYGGWYNETQPTDERSEAIAYFQKELPSLFVAGHRYFRTHLEFADSLVEIPQSHAGHTTKPRFTHTVALRPAELTTTVKPGAAACTIPNCRLVETRRWVRRRKACLEPGCALTYSTCFERREQKQVDVHLAADLLIGSRITNELALISADMDFVPAVVGAALFNPSTRTTWIRPKGTGCYLDPYCASLGVHLHNL